MLTLHKISKRYGEKVALQPTSLVIPVGKTTALIGPSGCGKSTLLRLMLGLLTPSSGEIHFDEVPVTPEQWQRLRHRIGYVIQDGGLFPHLTARQNVLLMSKYLRRDEAETTPRLRELCALTHFPVDALERYPVELSGGQRQRVSLMRALMLDPDVLMFDEPLGALDPMVRTSLQHELKEIFQRLEKTVVIVTHDLAEAAFLGDQIILMEEGRIAQQGDLEDLRERPASPFVSTFLNAQRGLSVL